MFTTLAASNSELGMSDNGSRPLRLETPHAENRRLREENARLRQLLAAHGIPVPSSPADMYPTDRASEAVQEHDHQDRARQRVALFRSLFRGRDDVYARRWESADGRAGYVPASLKDWQAINRSRPEDRKQVDLATRTLLPLSDTVIEAHLLGRETIGVYPLLVDESCWFLAADFDKETWAEDARAFLETCREWHVPAALERSRSGNGGHLSIFFDRALPATMARKLGCFLLTRTMERRHQVGLDSYDRFFPNQDTMPKGGFGNLIALPLQLRPRKLGNSVFLDADLQPYTDQWQFLASLQRMSGRSAEEIVAEAHRTGDLIGVRISFTDDDTDQDPWTLPPSKKRLERPITDPLPERVQLVRANLVYVAKQDLPSAMLNRLLRLAAFQNPEFYQAQALRLSTYAKPRVIACGEEFAQHIALPRGCLGDAVALLEAQHVVPEIRDERFGGMPIAVEFHGQLRAFQEEAVAEIGRYDEGVICAPTAFGKTVVAAWLIAERKVNTLVLVHRQQLLDQWRERLALFLDLPAKAIRQIGGGKTDRTGTVDVAVIQSLSRKGEVKDLVAEYGQVIVDECHHLSAFSFEQVLKQVKAKYVVGLTATPTRKDGHHPIIYMQCGPIRYQLSAKTMTEATPFEHRVLPRHTDFRLPTELGEVAIHDVYAALVRDASRNALIAADIARAVEAGRSPLLLTNRTEHLHFFAEQLSPLTEHLFVMKGGMGKNQRRALAEALATVPEHEPRVLLATGSYIGEGFDDARLDTLFLAMPISWRGTLQQYVGRLHRLHDNKRVVQVYDYVDDGVPMLARMYERRLRGYSAIGYVIEQDASLQDTLFSEAREDDAPTYSGAATNPPST
jgi:superfamily II DNA or RNA helicase